MFAPLLTLHPSFSIPRPTSYPSTSFPLPSSATSNAQTLKITDAQLHNDLDLDDLDIADQDRQHCRDFHSWIKAHSTQALLGLPMAECPVAKRAISSVSYPFSISRPSHL